MRGKLPAMRFGDEDRAFRGRCTRNCATCSAIRVAYTEAIRSIYGYFTIRISAPDIMAVIRSVYGPYRSTWVA